MPVVLGDEEGRVGFDMAHRDGVDKADDFLFAGGGVERIRINVAQTPEGVRFFFGHGVAGEIVTIECCVVVAMSPNRVFGPWPSDGLANAMLFPVRIAWIETSSGKIFSLFVRYFVIGD